MKKSRFMEIMCFPTSFVFRTRSRSDKKPFPHQKLEKNYVLKKILNGFSNAINDFKHSREIRRFFDPEIYNNFKFP